MTSDDKLRELGKAMPWERPDDARREALRASLLIAAEAELPVAPRGRRMTSSVAFVAGALAAAAVAVVVVRRGDAPAPAIARAQITASPAAEVEHSVTSTARGTDEIIRVHAGTVAIAAPGARPRDRVRVVTRDAEVEGAGTYDVTVAHDALIAVAMRSGTATVTVRGHTQQVFLSAGEVWHAEVVTAELMTGSGSSAAPRVVASASPPSTPNLTPTPMVATATPAPSVPTPMPRVASATSRTPLASATSTRRPSATPTPRPSATPTPTPSAAPTPPPIAAPMPPPIAAHPAVPAWRPTTLVPQDASSPRRTPAEPEITRLEPVAPASAPHRPSAIERHFQAGSTLLRANKLREAAVELAAAADASDVDPLALDARYLQATALVGAGQSIDAEHALVAFLDHAPRSIRRGRAEVLLARLIASRGDVASARAWFTAALDDPDPDVATAAQAGLAALRN